MPNKVIFSRIQNRRGPLENLPQPLRPGEIALTSDARRIWIGNEDIAPFGIRTYTSTVPVDANSLIQQALTERIVSIVFDAPLSQLQFDQLVDFLSRENNQIFPPFVAPSKKILLISQDETDYDNSAPNGQYVGGNGYSVNDVITLNNGARITVTSEALGVVDGFTVDYRGGEAIDDTPIAQQSVSPTGGTGFILTPRANNTTSAPSPDKATFYNSTEQVLWDGSRSVFVGLRVAELEFAAEKDSTWTSAPDTALNSILSLYPGGFPVAIDTVNIADDEFLSDWQGPATSAKIKNFSNPVLNSIASGNVSKLINLVAASSLIIDDSQDQSDYNDTGSNGDFTGGNNYVIGDVITISNGATIEVTNVSGGAVTEFTVETQGSQVITGFPLLQVSVVDSLGDPASGSGFSLTPESNNLVLVVSDETTELVTSVSNIEIGVVDIFDETEFPSDIAFENFEYEAVLDNATATDLPTGISFPQTESDSIFIEYTLRNTNYAATGSMRLSEIGGTVSVSDQRNTTTSLSGDITLSADYIGGGQQIRVLYTNTLSPATNDIVLKMVVRRWLSA